MAIAEPSMDEPAIERSAGSFKTQRVMDLGNIAGGTMSWVTSRRDVVRGDRIS